MNLSKDQILELVEIKARRQMARLSHALVRAPSEQREMIAAGLEFERWLADSCRDVLAHREPRPS